MKEQDEEQQKDRDDYLRWHDWLQLNSVPAMLAKWDREAPQRSALQRILQAEKTKREANEI